MSHIYIYIHVYSIHVQYMSHILVISSWCFHCLNPHIFIPSLKLEPQEAALPLRIQQGSPVSPWWPAGAGLAVGLLVAQFVAWDLGRGNPATPRDSSALEALEDQLVNLVRWFFHVYKYPSTQLCDPSAGSRVPGCRSRFWNPAVRALGNSMAVRSELIYFQHGCSVSMLVCRGSWPIVHQYLITLPWPKWQSHHNPSLSPFLERSWSIALGFGRPKATVVGTIAASRQHWHLGPWWIFIDFPHGFSAKESFSSLRQTNIAIEHGPFIVDLPTKHLWFSVVMWVYQLPKGSWYLALAQVWMHSLFSVGFWWAVRTRRSSHHPSRSDMVFSY